ncbi:hypothetical protein K438DRAFT_1963048 [Mycena galopus ATCC 62051]|nr:hypothetical protein K438DRAFT_1963048 [Mycena galopus ATCC 62051]
MTSTQSTLGPDVDPIKVVSKDQFDAAVVAVYQNCERIETPAEDVQILENLLGLSPGTLGVSAVGFPKGKEACRHCGRAFSFLDIAETGLQAHSKEFLVGVLTGKYGYIVNPSPKSFNCHKCGKECLDPGGHDIVKYVCNGT